MYKVLLKIGSPSMMVSGLSRTWSFFYTESTPNVIINKKGHAVFRNHNIPIRDPIWGHHCAGYIDQALKLAGGKAGHVKMTHIPGDEGDDFEFDITRR